MATNNDDIKWLYGKLKAKGYNIGSEQDFTSSLANDDDRNWYYEKAKGMGLNVGSMDDFNKLFAPQSSQSPTLQQPEVVATEVQSAQEQGPDVATPTQVPTSEQPQTVATSAQPTWQPTVRERVQMQHNMFNMLNDFNQQSKARMERVRRLSEPFSKEGRQKRKVKEFEAHLAGVPTKVMGLTRPSSPEPESQTNEDGRAQQQPAVKTRQSPVAYGVKYVDGKPVTQWLLPDGSLTTSFSEADQAEYVARTNRLRNEFEKRMTQNGLDPANADDVEMQAQLDAQAPAYDVVADLWKEAVAKHQADKKSNANKHWGSYAAMGGGREMRTVTASMNRNDNEVSQMTRFDLQNMMDNAWERAGSQITTDCYDRLRQQYPDASEEELQATASQMARSLSDNAVYQYAVQQNTPKSTLEYFGRTVADMNVINSISKGLARSQAGSSGDLTAYEQAMGEYGKNHRVARIAGTVTGMAVDPVTWVSGGMGSFAGKSAMWVGGRLSFGKAAPQVGVRLFGNTLGGRIAAGAAAGAGNFATYEGLKEAESQLVHGGHVNAETRENEGYSAEAVLSASGHGLVLGGVTGTLSPVIGNVADKTVKATTSTAGKVGVRGGEVAVSTLAEGTIFSVPEWINGEADAMDVWTDNMAMMLGFKAQHGIKSAPRVIAGLRPIKPTTGRPLTQAERNHNRMSFEERLRKSMDASPSDLAFTADEREELRRAGYGELADLFSRDQTQKVHRPDINPAEGAIELRAERVEAETVHGSPEYDGYSSMEELMQDGNVSQSARAKAYYMLTGRKLPMGTVTGYTTTTAEDGRVTISATTADGEIVTSRTFKNEQESKHEVDNIMRQAELNSVDVGERYKEAVADDMVLDAAISEVSPGADAATVKRIYRAVKAGNKDVTEAEVQLTEVIDEAIARNSRVADEHRPEAIRNAIKEETEIDVDAALRKMPSKRTEAEQDAIKTYIERLFPEEARQQAAEPTPEQAEAQSQYEQGRLLYGRFEEGDPTAQAESDAIALRMQEAKQAVEDAFGEDAEYWMWHVNEHPWTMVDDPAFTAEQQDAVLYYINAKAAIDGIMDASNDATDRKRNEVRMSVEKRTNKDSGVIIPATMKVDDRQVYIVKGNVMMFPDGTVVDVRNSSESVVVMDAATGEYEFTSPDQIFKVSEAVNPQDELDTALSVIEQEQMNIFGQNAVAPEEPMEEAQSVPETPESVLNPTENAVSDGEIDAEVDANEESGQQTALSRIPTNEQGEPQFEQAENPEIGWDALVEFSEGDAGTAKEIADAMVEEKRKAYEKAQKQKPKGKTPTEILTSKKAIASELAHAEQEYNLWQQMANVEQRRQNAIRSQEVAKARQRAAERAKAEKAEREAREEAERIQREALEGIPEWHMDTPDNARKRGARRFGGEMIVRQEPLQGVVGDEVEVKFSDRDMPKGRAVVIEASQLQPSHIQGRRNPMFFIDEAQPKNRTDEVSMMSAQEIAKGIRPKEITGNATAYTGAPTINTRGEVIQGNNRSDALRYLWGNNLPDQQREYKQYLLDNAEQFGVDRDAVGAMQNPVLVNMLDVEDAEAIRLGQMTSQDTESGGEERIKPQNVALKLGDEMRTFANRLLRTGDEDASFGQLVDRNGADVLMWMNQIGAISNTQYKSAFDTKGDLTAEAKNDLQKVLYQAVFKGGSKQLEEMFEKLTAKAQRAILSTAFRDMDSPIAGQMLPEIQSSVVAYHGLMNDSGFANAKKIEEALRAVEVFKRATAFDDRLEQYKPADNFSNFALHLAAMYKANDMSQSTIASYFNQMFDLAQGEKAATLFEEADTTQYPLAEIIKQVLNIDYQPAKNGNNNVANGGADVALRNQNGQGGELRGNESPASRERASSGTESSERGEGAEDDNNRRNSLGVIGDRSIADFFGPVYTEFRGKGAEAEAYLCEACEGVAKGALIYPGIAPIDLAWGDKKAGYMKIVIKHPEVVGRLQELLNQCTISNQSDNRIVLESDTHKFIVSKMKGAVSTDNWLLTAYEKKEKSASASSSDIETEPEGKRNGTATPQNGLSRSNLHTAASKPHGLTSERKFSDSVSEKQEKNEESLLQLAGNSGFSPQQVTEDDAEPTEAQKAAGNYKMGHRRVDGYNISIENAKGSVRRGTSADGKPWETTMQNDYGYIRGTEGVDGDHIDVFLSDTPEEGDVFVVDQVNEDGSFDEHKVMYGFTTEQAARDAYLSNYEQGWTGLGAITHVGKDEFKKWVQSSRRKTKPFAEYKSVKPVLYDNQGNPIDHMGKLIVENVNSIEEITDDDFVKPTRTIGLPQLPDVVSEAIGSNGKRVIIKKNIFGKNHKSHRDLTAKDSREILRTALYTPSLYGQNQKQTRPYNWILIHLADKNTCVLLEVDNSKESCEIVNWHYLGGEQLKQKERQAEREGGRILTLSEDNVVGNTSQGLSSDGKDNTFFADNQVSEDAKRLSADKQSDSVESSSQREAAQPMAEPYTITPTTYTNKKGKTSDVHLVKFNRELTAEEKAALSTFIREPLAEGRKTSRGWFDRKEGGYMMRSEEAARQLAEMIGNEEAVADAQPMTAEELREAVGASRTRNSKPEQQYEISNEEMQSLADELRDLLGIGDDEGDTNIKFRDPGELTPQERQRIQSAGIRLAMGLIERGTTAFPDYATKMVGLLGDKIRPWLKSFYEGARWTPGYDKYTFTPTEQVATFDVQNFDKQHGDPIAQAAMIVEERKASATSQQAQKELTEIRNKTRKDNDKQREADTAALAEKAEAVAGEAEVTAQSAGTGEAGRKRILRDLKRIDDTLEEVNDQLALLGYYEADLNAPEHEVYGLRRSAEKKAVKDAVRLAKQLVDDLSIDLDKVTGSTTDKRGKKPTAVSANVAPAGGDIVINLPYTDGRNLYINIGLTPTHERGVEPNRGGGAWEGDNFEVDRIMFRIEGGEGRRSGNQFLPVNVTYGKMLSEIKKVIEWGKPRKSIIGRTLSEREATDLIAQMESTAEVALELPLTPQNWTNEFGADGIIKTPIGEVKQGDNQYLKLAQQGRNGKLGMIKPTLEHPSIIIEDERPANNGNQDRSTSYVFIKTFINNDGSQYYHFTSITVSKGSKEVVISSQERSINRISKLLQQGKVTWIDKTFSLHPTTQIEESIPLNDSNRPTSIDSQSAMLGINSSELSSFKGELMHAHSDSKDNTFFADNQISEDAKRLSADKQSDSAESSSQSKEDTWKRMVEMAESGKSPYTVTKEVEQELAEQRKAQSEYKPGDEVEYSADGKKWEKAKVVEIDNDGVPVLDTGMAPVLYVRGNEGQIRRPKETIFEEAARVAKEAQDKKRVALKRKTAEVKPEQPIGDLFGGLFDISSKNDNFEASKTVSNEKRTDVQPRTGTTERERGHEPRQNESLGASQRNEAKGTYGRGMGGRDIVNPMSDGGRGGSVSRQPKSQSVLERLPESDRKNVRNNHAERGVDYAPKGEDARIKANIEAIELAKRLLDAGETATPEQMAVLRKFSGWGGLGKAFNEQGYTPNPIAKRLKELLGEDGYQDAVDSRRSAYYTPAEVIDTMWDVARAMDFKGGNVLEGSAGIGNILGLMPTDMSERSSIHAVEIDSTTGGILSLLYPDAKVEIQGFEKTKVPNGSVDLAITNVPFITGAKVFDETGDKDLSRKFRNIHDFCIAKNVRKLREGGIGIFITSSGTMDNSKELRRWIINDGNADVVGAFRMHNDTFGGTGATSDIIVVRKRVNGKPSPNAIDVTDVTGVRVADYDTGKTRKVKGKETPVINQLSMVYNKYFAEHPENMAGEMMFNFERGETRFPTSRALFPVDSKDQTSMLANWANSFSEMKEEAMAVSKVDDEVNRINERLGDGVKEGSIVVNSQGELCMARKGEAVSLGLNKNKVKGHTKAECFKAYSAIKKALSDVLEYQSNNEGNEGLAPLLKELNRAFDTFTKTYGNLHKNTAISFLRNDVDFSSILALETYSEKGDKKGNKVVKVGKTDIFSRRVIDTEKEPQPTTIKDGILASLYKNGGVDVEYIGQALGKPTEEVKREIVESGLGFEDPSTGKMEVSYKYLSGNVREKLHIAQENNEDGKYDANIKALEGVMPLTIPAHLIEFSLGSSWIEPKLYEDFVFEKTGLRVTLTNAGGTWFMKTPWSTFNEKNRAMAVVSEKCDKTIMGHELIEAAITNRQITVSKTEKHYDGSTETITDKSATAECGAKVDEIRAEFKDWAREHMQADAEMSARIEQTYNEQFNNYVPLTIPDEFVPQHFGGQVSELHGERFALRPHQGRAVVRGTTEPILLAHEVGTGKTFTLITTAMEMRRLGTARKPMIVVQNATVGQFVESAKEIYPNAKVLTIEEADRTAEGRKNFYAKIKYNDWDMIVVPQSVFERIPDSEEREMAYVKDIIEEKMKVLEAMREADSDGKSMIVRQAERELAEQEARLAELTETMQGKKKKRDEKREATTRHNAEVRALEMLDREVDDVENFDDMGIDAILVDEAHEYKHLGFATAMQRGVKGVDPSYSKKSQGVFLKAQAVMERNNGRNVVFATGTPISNTAAEIWTFMRYLMPTDTMKSYGIYYFDDFVRNFGNIAQMVEFGTNGKFKENNRFAGYVNLPELVRIWSSVADTVLTREAGGVSDKIPDMEGGKPQDIYLPQTRALRSVMKYVKAELDRYDKMTGKEKKENSHIPLTMYGIAKAAAVDVRLVVPNAEDDPNSKTNATVRETLRSLRDSEKYKGSVAIFSDNYQNKQSGFNLYEDIRKKLIAEGVPAEQIVVIKPGMTVKRKLDIFEKVNAGEIRVILGSTFTLGTGVNIQERLHTLIHVDAPNRPMDYTQRNGRALRQGNLHKDMDIPIRIIRFGVEDSLDVTAYQRLKTKGAIADSIMNGSKLMQNSMENRVLEEEEDTFGDMTAQLSGSEYAILKNQAEREVRSLTAKQKGHDIDQIYIHNQLPKVEGFIRGAEHRIALETKNLEVIGKHFPDGSIKKITVGKRTFDSVGSMEEFFKEQNAKMNEAAEAIREGAENYTSKLVVDVDGLKFEVTTIVDRSVDNKGQGTLTFEPERKVTYSCEELGIKDDAVKGNRLKNVMQYIADEIATGKSSRELLSRGEQQLEHYTEEKRQLDARKGAEFPFKQQLEEAKARLAKYEEAMKEELAEKEAKYAEMDKDVEEATDVSYTEGDDEETATNGDGNKYRLVEDANNRFNRQLERYINGDMDKNEMLYLGNPLGVMSQFLPELPIVMRQRVIRKGSEKKHEVDVESIMNMPEHLSFPIFVFQRSNDTIGVLTEMQDRKGKNVCVAIELNRQIQQGKECLEINDVRSFHGREFKNIVEPIVNNNTLKWVDKEKGLTYLSSASQQVQQEIDKEVLDSAAKVVENFENPTLDDDKIVRYQDAYDSSAEAKESRVLSLSDKLNTPVKLIRTQEEIDALSNRRQRRAKGWWSENDNSIVIVVPNNVNVADIENTFVHEVVGHKGLRALIGAERFDEFVGEVYGHASAPIRKEIDKKTNAMVDAEADRLRVRMAQEHEEAGEDVNSHYYTDMAKARVEAEKKREQYRKEATEEYMADMAGKIGNEGFEKMNREEQTLWGKIKAKVQQFLDKFLQGLKIAKSIKLTDKDLAYILFKSWKNMRGDKGVFAQAEDAVMRYRTGWDNENKKYDAREAVANHIVELFEQAVRGDLTGKPVEVGTLTAEGKIFLERLSGITMKDNVTFVLNPSDLVHMYRGHYGNNEKDKGNNIPLTKDDIRAIVDIICRPDKVIFGVERKAPQRNLFYFLSEAEVGAYNLLEIYGDRKGNLTAKTFYKTKKAVSQRVLSLMKSEHLTSVTDGASLYDGAKLPKFFECNNHDDEDIVRYHTDWDKSMESRTAIVEETNKRFNEELQQQIDGTLPEGHVYDMGMPSEYLLSTGIDNLPIKLSAKTLTIKSNLERHAYDLHSLTGLVKAIQKPWAIFSYGDKRRAQNLVIGVEDNGKQFIVGISIRPTLKGGRTLEINSVRNVFPKDNHEWINWINEGKLLRVDGKEEIQATIDKLRMNPMAFAYVNLDNAAKIVENFENPTLDDDKIIRYRTGWDKRNPNWKETCYALTDLPQPHSKNAGLDSQTNSDVAKVRKISDNLGLLTEEMLNPIVQGRALEINSVRNVFPKKNAEWLNWISQGKLLYADKQKIQALIDKQRTILADVEYLDLEDVAKVVENFENPTLDDDKIIRYRDGDDIIAKTPVLARGLYEQRVASSLYQVREALQDSMLGLKEAYDAIEKANGRKQYIEDIAGFENAYLSENRMSSKNQAEQRAYEKLVIKPMLDEVARLVPSESKLAELTEYMMAKHGLERNQVMAERDAQEAFDKYAKEHPQGTKTLQDFINGYREKDYAGLTALTGMDNVADAEDMARTCVSDYESMHNTDELWNKVNAATKATLSKLKECGLLSAATHDKIANMYDYYIPLRGWAETTADEVYGYLSRNDGNLRGSVLKKAEGRKSVADDPIATIALMGEQAIAQANRNKMKQAFFNYVRRNPSDLVSVNRLWLQRNDVTDEWEPVFASNIKDDDDAATVQQKIDAFEQKMESLAAADPDKYKRGRQARGIPYKLGSGAINEHTVLVKCGDDTYVMTINGNPRAAQALNGLTNPDVGTGVGAALFGLGEKINHAIAPIYTTRNPDFMVSNFLRDALYTNTMTWVKESPRYAARFNANFPRVNPIRMARLVNRYNNNTLDMNDPIERRFHEFIMEGGETGYTNQRDIEKHKKAVKKMLKRANGRITFGKVMDVLAEKWDVLNSAAENCARFAAYLTSLEEGRSIERAIYDAKEISVNFNKKGSGATFMGATGQTKAGNSAAFTSGTGRGLFVFWNAVVQASTNFMRNAKRHPFKMTGGLVVPMFLLGAVQAILGAFDDGQDDDDENNDGRHDYFNQPDYVRRSNILLRVGDQYLAHPLPHEYLAVFGMGEMAATLMMGKEEMSAGEISVEIAKMLSEFSPIPVDRAGWDHALMPSSVKPLYEASINESWTGMPIYKSNPYNEDMPEWTKAYSSANHQLVNLAEAINRYTGGDAYTKGDIDINPAQVEYVLNGYLGGYFKIADRMIKMYETATGEREFEWRNVPLVNRVVKQGDERTAMRSVNSAFFEYQTEYERIRNRIRGYESEADNGIFEYAEKLAELSRTPEFHRYWILDGYQKYIRAINKDLKEATTETEIEELEKERNKLRAEIVGKLDGINIEPRDTTGLGNARRYYERKAKAMQQ